MLYKNTSVSSAQIINGLVTGVRSTNMEVGADRKVIPYDYLVIATGSHYKSNIKTNVKGAHELALPVLEGLGINVMLNRRLLPTVGGTNTYGNDAVSSVGCKSFKTDKGDLIEADKVIWCTGYVPNTSYLREQSSDKVFGEALDAQGFVKVNSACLVQGCENVFALGDMLSAESPASLFATISPDGEFVRAERTAAAALFHALPVVTNVKRLAQGKGEGGLTRTDQRRMGGKSNQEISLGKYHDIWCIDANSYQVFSGMFEVYSGADASQLEANCISLAPRCSVFKETWTMYVIDNMQETTKFLTMGGTFKTFPFHLDPEA